MALNKYVDILISSRDGTAKAKEDLLIFEKDKGIDIYFRLIDHKYQYKLTTANQGEWNILSSLNGANAYITIVNPQGEEITQGLGNSNVVLKDDYVKFTVTEELTDELDEIGEYMLQIHVLDKLGAEASIPPFSFQVKERLKGITVAVNLLAEDGSALLNESGNNIVVSGSGIKISNLTPLDSITGNEYIPISINGVTYKIVSSLVKGKDGANGKSIEYAWDGTRLGVRQEGELTYTYIDLKGSKGDQGIDGISPALSIGTVTTLESNQSATASFSGTASNPILNLEIPQGVQGNNGISISDTLVTTAIVGTALTLTTDKYQTTTMVAGTTIVLPTVTSFKEIHLFFSTTEALTVTFPTVKWQTQPSIVANKTYEIIFTYINNFWIGGMIAYE